MTQMLDRDAQQPRWRFRQKSKDGLEFGEVRSAMADRGMQPRHGMLARLARLARIQTERAFHTDVVDSLPAGIGRQIVGVESDEGIWRIAAGRLKITGVVTLEHHHPIRPQSPIGETVAETFGHRAEVLADDDAAMRGAFERDDRQHGFERHLDIDALIRLVAMRHDIKPVEPEDMIETDRTGVTHRGPQHLAKRCEIRRLQPGGIVAGEPPILSRGVELVRRRADRKLTRNRALLVPRIEAIGFDADRDVEIEPDRHPALPAQLRAFLQLLVGAPLHEGDIFDLGGIGPAPQFGECGVIGPRPWSRPLPPRPGEFPPQDFKTGKTLERLAALGAKYLEGGAPPQRGPGLELLECQMQRLRLQSGDGDVIDKAGLPQPLDLGGMLGREGRRQFRQSRHVDIDRIQEQPAARRIRAAIGRMIVEQGMQRVEADARRASVRRPCDRRLQIAEIANAPIPRRSEAIKLQRENPSALEATAERFVRRGDQACLVFLAVLFHGIQTINTVRQIRHIRLVTRRKRVALADDAPCAIDQSPCMQRQRELRQIDVLPPARRARARDKRTVKKSAAMRRAKRVDHLLLLGLNLGLVVGQ